MFSIARPIKILEVNLEGPLLVAVGRITGSEKPDIVVAGANEFYVYQFSNGIYQLAQRVEVQQPILSLATGLPSGGSDKIILGTEDRLVAYGSQQGSIRLLWQTEPENNAQFTDQVLVDLDGNGSQDLVAMASGLEALYIYSFFEEVPGTTAPQLLGIRQLLGKPVALTAFRPLANRPPYLAIAYNNNGIRGIQTLYLGETGFIEGPSVITPISDLTAANLLAAPGEELAGAAPDGSVKIFRANGRLITALVTNNLGSSVTAVEAQNFEGDKALLVAGTPGAYVFGFNSPGLTKSPNWALKAAGPINDLAVVQPTTVALGTTNGIFQVWELA